MLAAIRPDSWNYPLFIHVLGAMVLVGALVTSGRQRELVIRKVDGQPVSDAPARAALLDAGFVAGYRGLVLRGAR